MTYGSSHALESPFSFMCVNNSKIPHQNLNILVTPRTRLVLLWREHPKNLFPSVATKKKKKPLAAVHLSALNQEINIRPLQGERCDNWRVSLSDRCQEVTALGRHTPLGRADRTNRTEHAQTGAVLTPLPCHWLRQAFYRLGQLCHWSWQCRQS